MRRRRRGRGPGFWRTASRVPEARTGLRARVTVAALSLSPRRGVHQKKEPILKSLPKNARARSIAFICTCLVPLAAWAGDDAERIRAVVDAAVLPLMSRYDVPGMAVAVTVDGRPYLFDYGLASRESKAPVDEKTIF